MVIHYSLSPLHFYVVQFTSSFRDDSTKSQCNAYLYRLNQLREQLNGITTLSVMLLAGSDYADGCFSSSKTGHFRDFLQYVIYQQSPCICIDKLLLVNTVVDTTCNYCKNSIDSLYNKRIQFLLKLMGCKQMGAMPLFDETATQDMILPFISIALVTVSMVSSNIHRKFRCKSGYLKTHRKVINDNYIFIWFELLYFILVYLNPSSNYFSLLHKSPQAHFQNIPTKILLFDTATFLNNKVEWKL